MVLENLCFYWTLQKGSPRTLRFFRNTPAYEEPAAEARIFCARNILTSQKLPNGKYGRVFFAISQDYRGL